MLTTKDYLSYVKVFIYLCCCFALTSHSKTFDVITLCDLNGKNNNL